MLQINGEAIDLKSVVNRQTFARFLSAVHVNLFPIFVSRMHGKLLESNTDDILRYLLVRQVNFISNMDVLDNDLDVVRYFSDSLSEHTLLVLVSSSHLLLCQSEYHIAHEGSR
jgi:hypothetical protein